MSEFKKKYVYLIEEELRNDANREENRKYVMRAYTSLKKAIEYLEYWAEIERGTMNLRGIEENDPCYWVNYVERKDKSHNVLFVRNGVELKTWSINKELLF